LLLLRRRFVGGPRGDRAGAGLRESSLVTVTREKTPQGRGRSMSGPGQEHRSIPPAITPGGAALDKCANNGWPIPRVARISRLCSSTSHQHWVHGGEKPNWKYRHQIVAFPITGYVHVRSSPFHKTKKLDGKLGVA